MKSVNRALAVLAWEDEEVADSLRRLCGVWHEWPAHDATLGAFQEKTRMLCDAIENRFIALGAVSEKIVARSEAESHVEYAFLKATQPDAKDWDMGYLKTGDFYGKAHPLVSALRLRCEGGAVFLLNGLGSPSVIHNEKNASVWLAYLSAVKCPASEPLLNALVASGHNPETKQKHVLAWLEGAFRAGLSPAARAAEEGVKDMQKAVELAKNHLIGSEILDFPPIGSEGGNLESALVSLAFNEAKNLTPQEALTRARAQLTALLQVAPLDRWPLDDASGSGFLKGSPPEDRACHGLQIMSLAAKIGAWWALDILASAGAPWLRDEQVEHVDWDAPRLGLDMGERPAVDLLYDPARAKAILEKNALLLSDEISRQKNEAPLPGLGVKKKAPRL